jgi:hypothetical protein
MPLPNLRNSGKKSSNTTKTNSQKPKNAFICCSVVIEVQDDL